MIRKYLLLVVFVAYAIPFGIVAVYAFVSPTPSTDTASQVYRIELNSGDMVLVTTPTDTLVVVASGTRLTAEMRPVMRVRLGGDPNE